MGERRVSSINAGKVMAADMGQPHPPTLQQSVVALFAKDSLKYFSARVVQAILGVVSTYAFTRLLSAAAYGDYSLALGVVTPLLALISEWAAQPAARFFRQYEVEGRKSTYTRVFLVLLAGVLFLAFVSALVLSWAASAAWGRSLVLAASAMILVDSVFAVLGSILPVSQQGGAYRTLQVSRAAVLLLTSVGFVRLFGPTGSALLWGGAVSGAIVLVPTTRMALRALGPWGGKEGVQTWLPNWTHLSRFLWYGLPMMVWFFGSQLLALGDRFVIGLFRGSAEVGVYAASYNVVNSLTQVLAGPILFAASPIIWRLWAESSRAEVQKAIADISGWFVTLGAGLVGGLGLLASDVFTVLLGPDF